MSVFVVVATKAQQGVNDTLSSMRKGSLNIWRSECAQRLFGLLEA